MVPARSAFPLLPDLVERFGEILDESLLRWPLRWPETSLRKDLVRIPVMDVFEEGDTIVVKAEIPGLAKGDETAGPRDGDVS
jgi:HSP20 family molecular chaperone IbpA